MEVGAVGPALNLVSQTTRYVAQPLDPIQQEATQEEASEAALAEESVTVTEGLSSDSTDGEGVGEDALLASQDGETGSESGDSDRGQLVDLFA